MICQNAMVREHGLEYISFYVQKHIASLMGCSGPPVVHDGPMGAPVFVRLAYCWGTSQNDQLTLIGSVGGLIQSGNKPLPGPILIQITYFI